MAKTPKSNPKSPSATPASQTHATRETIESVVIAFVLAFLFRTFEAEAFVIPTGSMANTLMGRHKDVACAKCGHRYQVSSSEEVEDAEQRWASIRSNEATINANRNNPPAVIDLQNRNEDLRRSIPGLDIVGGVCPVCRFAMPMAQRQLPTDAGSPLEGAAPQPSYNGDRILVNKYLYNLRDPRRWEVVVFHFPGNAEQNYIKRLVGLPEETLRIYQGDLHVANNTSADGENGLTFKIARKPADTVLAMRQIVHDTDYDPAELHQAGWPLRWQPMPAEQGGWQVETKQRAQNIAQRYTVDRSSGGEAWLRYVHTVPSERAWQIVSEWQRAGNATSPAVFPSNVLRPELITDFNSYNTRVLRDDVQGTNRDGRAQGREAQNNGSLWPKDESKLGLHWVGDLMAEANVEVLEAKGKLRLSLVEAGKHFGVQIDLTTGVATLEIEGQSSFAPQAKTPLSAAGEYRVALANVDDQLLLWVDGDLIEFEQSTEYDSMQVYGARALRPQTTDEASADRLDFSPVGIGANGAKLAVSRLQVWRDIYYIADSWERRQGFGGQISDFHRSTDLMITTLRYEPNHWDTFLQRQPVDFRLAEGQFFVLGDNSPASSDARLWLDSPFHGGRPGGAYLEREQLIGKAICVYWPHAAYSVFGIPLVPNVWDMRLVR
jgi:signal peptidase I